MGLDMYLWKINRQAVGFKEFDPDKVKESNPVLYAKMKPYIKKRGSDIFQWESLYDEVGYWRKANQIHRWFVDNVQDGEDACREYEVSREQLTELLAVCMTVLNNSVLILSKVRNGYTFDAAGNRVYNLEDGKRILNPETAASLLPTQEGFFFGSTDYDEYYFEDIVETVNILQKVLSETDFDTHAIYYGSSW